MAPIFQTSGWQRRQMRNSDSLAVNKHTWRWRSRTDASCCSCVLANVRLYTCVWLIFSCTVRITSAIFSCLFNHAVCFSWTCTLCPACWREDRLHDCCQVLCREKTLARACITTLNNNTVLQVDILWRIAVIKVSHLFCFNVAVSVTDLST